MNSLKSIYDHGIFILYDNIFIYNDLRIELKNIFNKFFIEEKLNNFGNIKEESHTIILRQK